MTAVEPLDAPHAARLTTRDFLLLVNSGAFDVYAKAELIEGEIFVVNAQFRRHAEIRRKLMRQLEDALIARTDGLGAVDECSVEFGDTTMPQPDITLTTAPQGEGPIPIESVRLVIEIADTTAGYDLGKKRDLYARYGIPEYWVIDLKGRRISQFWAPRAEVYIEGHEVIFGEIISSRTLEYLDIVTIGI